ncbi:MAG: O-antigen ligase family protein [Acidobacteriota bacterium]
MSSTNAVLTNAIASPHAESGLALMVGAFFSARTIAVLLSVRILGVDPRTGAALVLALDIILLCVAWFNSVGPAEYTFGSMLKVTTVRWVIVFLTFSCCSLAWSRTVSLPTSFAYWCGMAADVLIVFLLLRTESATVICHSLMKGFIWSTCCLALIAWIMPTQADLRLGDEQFFNTNQIGNLCAFAILMAQYLVRRKAGKWWPSIAFLSITLLRSLSKTTIVAFLVSEGYLMIQDRAVSRKTKLLLIAGTIAIGLVFWGLFAAYYDVYTTAGNQAETLTGRTAIWAYVLNEAVGHPWIGHGFDSMWKVVPPFGHDQFEARHAENEVLQQFYAYGFVGLIMLGGLYGSLYRDFRRLQRGSVRVILISMLIFFVVRGLAEAEPFDLLLPCWAIVQFSMLARDVTDMEKGDGRSVSMRYGRTISR